MRYGTLAPSVVSVYGVMTNQNTWEGSSTPEVTVLITTVTSPAPGPDVNSPNIGVVGRPTKLHNTDDNANHCSLMAHQFYEKLVHKKYLMIQYYLQL